MCRSTGAHASIDMSNMYIYIYILSYPIHLSIHLFISICIHDVYVTECFANTSFIGTGGSCKELPPMSAMGTYTNQKP